MNFSATALISQAWDLWKKHIVFTWMVIGVLFVVTMVFGIFDPNGKNFLVSLISMMVTLFFELGAISLFLKLVRTGEEGKIEEIIGQKEIYLQALIGNILYYLMMIVGFIFLIIPGIYVAVRFMMLPYVFVDQKLGWKEALKEASRLSEGYRWDLFGLMILIIIINFAGALLLLVGLLVSIPVSALATALTYDHLKKMKDGVTEEITTEKIEEEKKEEVIDLPETTPEPVV